MEEQQTPRLPPLRLPPTKGQVMTFCYEQDQGRLDVDFVHYAKKTYDVMHEQLKRDGLYMSVRDIWKLMRQEFARLNAPPATGNPPISARSAVEEHHRGTHF